MTTTATNDVSDERLVSDFDEACRDRERYQYGTEPRSRQRDAETHDEWTNTRGALVARLTALRALRAAIGDIAGTTDCPHDAPADVVQHVIGCMGALRMLRDEAPGLRADAARLEWLEEQWDGFANIDRITSVDGAFNGQPKLREAIDTAREVTP